MKKSLFFFALSLFFFLCAMVDFFSKPYGVSGDGWTLSLVLLGLICLNKAIEKINYRAG